jgi:hypothetical protein
MPHTPTTTHELPRDVALKLARLAKIPPHEVEGFCDVISNTVNEVWSRDRRAVSFRPGKALIAAATAALNLNKALCSLAAEDRKWLVAILETEQRTFLSKMCWDHVDGFTGQPIPKEQLIDLNTQVWELAFLLSTAAGRPGPPAFPGVLRHRVSRRRDPMFEFVIRHLRLWATEHRGRFTFSKRNSSGTLLKALDILRPHLPRRVVPNALPLTTMDRVIAAQRKVGA